MNGMVQHSIPRLVTALAEWGACAVYIRQFPVQSGPLRRRLVLALALPVQLLWLELTGGWPEYLWLTAMVLAVVLMGLWIGLCCELTPITVCYCTVRAFILAEFAASLVWQIYYYFVLTRQQVYSSWITAVFVTLAYGLIFAAIHWLERHLREENQGLRVTVREFWPVLIIGSFVFLASNLSFVYSDTPFSSTLPVDINNIRTLVDLAGVAILYTYHFQRSELHLKQELDAVQNAMRLQHQQYELSRESIDLINRKYHDLKHQIAFLRSEPDAEQRGAYLDRMEQEIRNYEAQNKTGNHVLDTVLTSKSLYCAQHGITLTCVADGGLLDFMDALDLSAVFGNALDNAIECEEKISDPERRLIHLSVSARQELVFIRVENYCEGELSFSDGLPLTTKQDKNLHGYGVKSIRYVAQKYGGAATVHMERQWFVLQIVLPLPKR